MRKMEPLPMIESTSLQDTLLIILQYLSFKDIIAVSLTCKSLWRTCMAKQLWLHVWRRNVMQEKLPTPQNLLSLDLLGDFDMKKLTMHALRLHHEMACPPEQRTVQRVDVHQARPITWTQLVRGSWLLVAMSDTESSVLALYSVQSLLGMRSQDLLAQAFLEGPVINGLVEVSNEHGIIIALELRTETPTVEILSARYTQGSMKFVRLARHCGISHIYALHGSLLGFAVHDNISVPSILDWKTGSVTHMSHRPDTDGGVVAMILHDDYLIFLTPRKLHIMRICTHGDNAVHHSTISTFALDVSVWNATLALCQEDHQVTVQICISNSGGLYVYSTPLTHVISTQTDPPLTLLWSREISLYTEPLSPFRMIAHPLVDRTFTTISWLETASYSRVTRYLPSLVQFVTITERLSDAQLPLNDPPCFGLSERSMPALYAQSTRDYDGGLGLLVVGNAMGELALYSFSGDTFGPMQDILQPVIVPSWNGEDLLPQTSFIPYPPRKYSEQPGFPTEAERRAYQQLWDKYWPAGLEVPKGWRRSSPDDDIDQIRWLDAIGNESWNIENASHFLGQVIPLICTRNGGDTLLQVGGLFLLYHADVDSLYDPFYSVLRPDISLEEIVARLPGEFVYDEDYTMGGAEANTMRPDTGLNDELQFMGYAWEWERRHFGHDRWRNFEMRGGKRDIRVFWSEESIPCDESLEPVENIRIMCVDDCPLCA